MTSSELNLTALSESLVGERSSDIFFTCSSCDLSALLFTKSLEMARATFSAASEWNGSNGFHIESRCKSIKMGENRSDRASINTIVHDFPPQFSGKDSGPTVCETCMASLGACITQTIVMHASAMGIPLDGIKIDIEGDLDIRGFAGLSSTVRPVRRRSGLA